MVVHAIKNRSLHSIARSPSSPITEGVLTRRNDTRTRLVTWGTTTTGATPTRSVKKWYSTIPSNPAEALLHARTKEWIGVPVYRVDPKTKGNKAAGSRGHCVECHRLTNYFCIICKKWLCDAQLAANHPKASGREEEKKGSKIGDPKFIKVTFDDGSLSGKEDYICAIYSCWYKAHQGSLEANGAVEGGWC
jgi:hypothetical protein